MDIDKLSKISLIFIALVIVFFILYEFQEFLRPFIIALILSFLFVPLTRMSKQRRRTIWLVTFVIIAGLFFSVAVLSSLFLEDTTDDLQEDRTQEDFYIEKLVEESFTFGGAQYSISQFVDSDEVSEYIEEIAYSMFETSTSFLTEFFLVLVFLFFLLPSHDLTVEKIGRSLNPASREKFLQALTQIETNIRHYLSIKSAISGATAVFSAIIMFAFDVSFLILLTFLIFFLNFIPTLGSIIAVTVVLLVNLATAGISLMFFVFAALIIAVQLIMGNFIDPKYVGKGLELSPIIVLLSLFFWGSVWGIAGMFFAVPLTSIMKIVLSNIDGTKDVVKFLK